MDELTDKLKGLGVALVTPFNADGSIDFNAFEKLIEHVLNGGADYLVVLGTTAETPTLSAEEKKAIRDFVVKKSAQRVPLILGYGGNNTTALVEELRTDDLSGFDAILSVVPYYNKPCQEGIYRHFAAAVQASPLPVILYNIPGRTGVNMSPETTLRLANDFKGKIIAIKEASGSLFGIDSILMKKPEEFCVISGDDALTYPLMSIGACGVISVIANAFPKKVSAMVKRCLEGNFDEALKIHHQLSDLNRLIFVDGNPAGIKALLTDLGILDNILRLPLIPARNETKEKLRLAATKIGAL